MPLDRRLFLATLGGGALPAAPEALADALEQRMLAALDQETGVSSLPRRGARLPYRRGVGLAFVGDDPRDASAVPKPLPPLPARPTLADFFAVRFARITVNHVLQSAEHARKAGHREETILACLLHDLAINLVKADHGWWGADLVAPYVSEKVAWAIRYHQALRFYADPAVGYEYPALYHEIFGRDYVPPPHIAAAYKHAREHKWYMEARLVTLSDVYAFDPKARVSIEPFLDIIGRHFRQPEEGLGNDNSPAAHMWRTLADPDQPL
jgi:hypothetical protein